MNRLSKIGPWEVEIRYTRLRSKKVVQLICLLEPLLTKSVSLT